MNLPSNSWLFGSFPAEIVILAGIHGNESANVDTIKEVMNYQLIKNSKKSILFVIGNPLALEKNLRFTETDLNREFGVFSNTYEGKRAKELAQILEKAKVLIDLHLTQTPTLEPFVIVSNHKQSIEFLKQINIPIENCVITDGFNPNTMSTDEYLLSHNSDGIALTLELGSIFDDKSKIIALGKKIIEEILKSIEFKESKDKKVRKITLWKETQKVPNKPEIKLLPGLQNFMSLKKGQVIAYENNNHIISEYNGKALFPKYTKTEDSYLLRIITKQ